MVDPPCGDGSGCVRLVCQVRASFSSGKIRSGFSVVTIRLVKPILAPTLALAFLTNLDRYYIHLLSGCYKYFTLRDYL